jgi:dTDP-4-dehydrorhamnose reductase
VNHLTVVRARAHTWPRLALEDAYAVSALGQRPRSRESHHAGADDCDVDLLHVEVRLLIFAVGYWALGIEHSALSIDRVLVTGASGQLAAYIVQTFADRQVVALTRQSLDVTDPAAVARIVADTSPHLIVNCAAFNDVDGAESQAIEALAINALAVRSLARAAEASGAVLVHYSTDFVLNSDSREPHGEDVRPAPRGVYASSKLLGEWFALESAARPAAAFARLELRRAEEAGHDVRAYVLRVESLFGSPAGWTGRRGTLDHIVDGLRHGREVKVFTDRIVSPSYSKDVAAATRHLVLSGAPAGVYHCVNDGHASWHDVAAEAARILGVQPRLVPMTVDHMPLRVPRPRYCALSTTKLAAAGFTMPTWQDGLERWLRTR